MLLNLHVKNLALIDEADIDFTDGLNIMTGETGAGKSIVIGSVNVALGSKASRDIIGKSGDFALVELVFSVENEKQRQALSKRGIQEEDGQIIISRKIMEGRSIVKINGETMPISVVKEIAAYFIDIHGQHEHQSLLNKKKHLEILDEFAKEDLISDKSALYKQYQEYQNYKSELKNFSMDEEEKARKLSFLEYEIQEIEEAQLQAGEDEELEQRYKKLANSRKIMDALSWVHRYTGYDDENSAGEGIGRALREMQSVSEYDKDLDGLEAQLQDLDSLLNDFNRELSSYMDTLEFAEEEFQEIETRLDLINRLKTKYGKTIPAILDYKQEKEAERRKLAEYEEHLAQLQQSIKKSEDKLKNISGKISSIRKKYAAVLVERITKSLEDLNFLDVKFEMNFSKLDTFTPNGTDDAQFFISTNPGEPVKPLNQVVSGGELSRIMLAVKTVLADKDSTDTLIFDEIDVGISGRTAQRVSEKMALIADKHQVICITHLPQIAAMADTHFLIEKKAIDKKTSTYLRKLSIEEAIQELARILGGAEITEAVIQNAREMKLLAEKKRNSSRMAP